MVINVLLDYTDTLCRLWPMSFPHLSKAPIVEAIIDIQCTLPEDKGTEDLLRIFEELHGVFCLEFPIKEPHVSRFINVNPKQAEVKEVIQGYFFRSLNRTRVLQFRNNGFTLSHLAPYDKWEVLRDDALKHWKIFSESMIDLSINRVATRYINRIKVPFPLTSSTDYLRSMKIPVTEPRDSKSIRSFVDQVVSIDSQSSATVGLVTIMQEPATSSIEADVLIDMDISRHVRLQKKDEQQLLDIINSFQDVKNRIFFSTVGPKTIELYL